LKFPGRIIKKGETDPSIVKRIQKELAKRGYGDFVEGVYNAKMAATVALFQSQNLDQSARPLSIDGQVGPFTWGALFDSVLAIATSTTKIRQQALTAAISQIGQSEVPPGSNRGPQVNEYLASVGLPPDWGEANQRAWCAAFVYWCFNKAALKLGTNNPPYRSAGVLNVWRNFRKNSPQLTLTKEAALMKPSLITAGAFFIHDYGSGLGHTGFVEEVLGDGRLVSVEGNVAAEGEPGREGVCVARVTRRKLTDDKLVGFVLL